MSCSIYITLLTILLSILPRTYRKFIIEIHFCSHWMVFRHNLFWHIFLVGVSAFNVILLPKWNGYVNISQDKIFGETYMIKVQFCVQILLKFSINKKISVYWMNSLCIIKCIRAVYCSIIWMYILMSFIKTRFNIIINPFVNIGNYHENDIILLLFKCPCFCLKEIVNLVYNMLQTISANMKSLHENSSLFCENKNLCYCEWWTCWNLWLVD